MPKQNQGELPAMPERDEVGKRALKILKLEEEIEELRDKRVKLEQQIEELLKESGRQKVALGGMSISLSYTSAKTKVVIKKAQ